jgi:outer membrane protein
MKRIVGLFILTVVLALSSQAQKFGYVDTELILSKMDEYKAAKQEIDNLSQKWQKELEDLYAGIEKMYKDYQAEEVLLTDDIKKLRQEDIMGAERKAKEYKEKKFGYDGELYKVQDDKIKPIQDKVYDAVEKVAQERSSTLSWTKLPIQAFCTAMQPLTVPTMWSSNWASKNDWHWN